MRRTLEKTQVRITPLTVADADGAAWLRAEMEARGLPYLLAHAEDGVIWGRLADGQLLTSHEALCDEPRYRCVSPPLRGITLQQARAFGPTAELLLWRDGDGALHARLIEDDLADGAQGAHERETLDELQMLWGDTCIQETQGFVLWREGAQGMLHAVPHPTKNRPPLLAVRHYLADASTAHIELSRLTDLISDTATPRAAVRDTQQEETRA
jgi:CRISPR-associated protein (TIGR03984 family)